MNNNEQPIEALNKRIEELKRENIKTYNQLMDNEREYQSELARLNEKIYQYDKEIEKLKLQRASSEVVSELSRYEEIIKKLNNTIDVLIEKIKE